MPTDLFRFTHTKPLADFGTPRLWNVCFSGKTCVRPWERFLKPGFRHVYLVGYVAEFDLWLEYQVLFAYTTLAIVSEERASGLIGRALDEGDVLTVAPEFHMKHNPLGYFCLWCVPAVRHALGLRCVAITPQGLHRFLLNKGAKSLKAEIHEQLQRAESQTGQGSAGRSPSPADACG